MRKLLAFLNRNGPSVLAAGVFLGDLSAAAGHRTLWPHLEAFVERRSPARRPRASR